MKLALQLYSLRQFLNEENITDTLAKVRAMGYEGAEWPGLCGFSADRAAELTQKAGLEMFSVMINIDEMIACDREYIRVLKSHGVKYLPISHLPAERLAGGELFDETCEIIRKYCAAAAEEGLWVLYHNHDFDLDPVGDSRALDVMYETLPGYILGAELDTCWLYSGGVDPAAYVRKYADRTPILHLKDCVKEGGRAGYRPVGMGVVDFDSVIPEAKSEWFCVEQDDPCDGYDAFECAAISAKCVREKYLK